ncbi:hypothetical protein [Azospirillum sp.]|uniref:hypothetical protein n=1 Tax=Azospirillum sp. TaxID=34012 RepID=UPI002D2F5C75|nr:hypothetical protein [Azospirillum sp.]HYD66156.1 hypothetical protein [Azospirillum sp.]
MTLHCTGFAFFVVQMTCTDLTPPPAVVCPPVRTWTREFRNKVAAEMRAAPSSALAEVAVQSIGDRAVARACAQAKRR